MINTEDEELVLQAKAGSITAFEQLVHKHDKQVLAIAARYVTSSEDAKDIYQEVFIRVYRGLKHFKMKSEFSTWLHRITVNVCLTHRSRRKRFVHVPIDGDGSGDGDPETHGVELQSNDDPADQHSVDSEIRGHVQDALESLSAKQRLVFTLKHFDGYKLREIADMMKCTEGTVKRYLFLATQQLRERLRVVYE
ncbi:MAG: RNA polymerase sigma factor [Bacteroidetes bacterium]|nr:RNA polymerase sigma factor [Bacteroidota bacterium]MCW5895720.1 RNA polymerase sigma factor [Bacteroidota bacterium]